MKDGDKTKEKLINELAQLRRRFAKLEAAGQKRNQLEEALRIERDKAQHYLDIAEVMLVALNKKGKIILINRKGNQILEYREGELLGKNWFTTCVPTDRRKKSKSRFVELMAGKITLTEFYENPVLTKSGIKRTIAWHNTLLKDEKGSRIGTLSSGMDITERKQAEEALRKSEDRYRTILENIEEGYYEADLAGNFTFLNDAMCRIWGYPKKELMGMNNRQYTDKETAKRVFQVFNKVYKTGKIGKGYDYEIIKKDGTRSYVEASISLRKDSVGKAIGFRGIIRDITERKQAEEALRQKTEESERQYRMTINSMGDAIHVIDKDLRFVLFNDAFKRWNQELGLETNVIGRTLAEIFPFLTKKVGAECRHVFKTGKPLITEENTKINGRQYITETRKIPIFEGSKVTRIATIIRNITERKQAEDEIRESKQLLEKTFSSLRDALLIIDAKTLKIIDCNPAASEIFGYKHDEMVGQTVNFLHVDDKTREEFSSHLYAAIKKQGFLSRFEFKMMRKDGTIFPTEHNVSAIEDQRGNRSIWVSIVRDIAETKRAGAALQESEATLRALINAPTDSVLLLDPQGIILDLNEIAAERLGKSRDELIGTLADAALPADVAKKRRALILQVLKTGRETRFEDERGGIWFDTVAHPITDKDGAIGKIAIIARDITERKAAEAALRENEERYRRLVNNSLLGIGISCGSQIVFANPALLHLYGYDDIKEFTNIPLLDSVAPASRELIISRMERVAQGKAVPAEFEYDILCKDGSIKRLLASSSNFTLDGKIYTQTTFQDITDRKQAEVRLRESQRRFQGLVETLSDWIWEVDQKGIYTYVSPRIKDLLGYEWKEVLGKTPFDLMPPEEADRVKAEFEQFLSSHKPIVALENTNCHKDGHLVVFETSGAPFFDAEGQFIGFRGVDRDITDRKQVEEALKERQETIRAIIETSQDWIWAIDSQGVHTYSNPAIEKILGYKSDEIVGNISFNLIHEDDKNWADLIVQECREKRCGWKNLLLRWRHKDGTYRYLESNAVPILNSKGDILGFRGVDRDITERKQAEEKIRKSEQSYKSLFDEAVVGICLADAETGIIVDCNQALTDLVHREKTDLIGKPQKILHPPQDTEEIFSSTFKQHLNDKKGQILETQVITKTGDTREVEIKANLLDLQGRKVLQGLFHDITDRKRSEKLANIRLRLLEFAATHSLAELLQKTLDEVCEFTISLVGFYHFVNEDQKTLSLQAWSTRTVKEFCKAEGTGMHYGIDQAGVWVDCIRERRPVIHNDYASLPHRKGMPDGHAAIVRELVVPIMRNDRFVAILGIGNKPQDYTDQDAQVVSYLADVAWEIAERKEAREALEESEKKYRQVVENATDIIYTTDINGNFKYANAIALKLTGYSHEELQRFNYLDLVVPEFRDRLKEIYGNQFRTREATTYVEFPFTNKFGEVMWFGQNASLMIENERIIGFQVIARDISKRKQAEEALRKSEEKYRDLVENISDIIYATDETGIVTYISPGIESVGGYTPSEVIGRTFLEFVYQEDMSDVVQLFKQDISGQAAPHEYRMVAKAGDVRWVRVSSRPIFEGARIVGLRGILTDITERKKAEEEIMRGYEQVQETLHATINALAATVEMKDQYTAGHQPRVTKLACAIAEEMGLSEDQIEGIRMAASIHDIGKIMVPAEILNKPGPLTEIQYEMIKMHSQAGHDILRGLKLPWPVAQIILQHHERLDGSGYPQGLSGEKIMLEARILAVANVVEAMNAHRPYRPAYDIQEALAEISQNRGTFYDASVVDACLRLFKEKGFVLDSLPR